VREDGEVGDVEELGGWEVMGEEWEEGRIGGGGRDRGGRGGGGG